MRFVVDFGVVLRFASEETKVSAKHQLLAPTLLRSQTLSALHEGLLRIPLRLRLLGELARVT